MRKDKRVIITDSSLTNPINPKMNELPSISIIIPTLNSEKTLKDCLGSIAMQDYPEDKIEIIIADGGSTDSTLNIVSEFSVASNLHPQPSNIHIVPNRLKTGEAGKAVGLKHAKNEIIAFIDSDNILPDKDWLKRMVEPFNDPEIVASEPIEYTYRPDDGYITRYCALLGMNDPLCLFLGNYDRLCTLSGRWTEMPHKEEDKDNYLKIELDKKSLPTIGANGFLIRRSVLLSALASPLQPMPSTVQPFASNLKPQTSNVSVSTSNLHPLTSSVSVSASNLQPPTSNLKHDLELGIWYREDGKIKSTGNFKLNHDLDRLPFIDRDLTKWWLYSEKNGNYKYLPGTYTMAARDCWWERCSFCS